MNELTSVGSLDCPFLRPVTVDYLWMYPTAVFCRPPSGHVRVPCPDTLTRICMNGHYRECDNYLRSDEGETTPEAI